MWVVVVVVMLRYTRQVVDSKHWGGILKLICRVCDIVGGCDLSLCLYSGSDVKMR